LKSDGCTSEFDFHSQKLCGQTLALPREYAKNRQRTRGTQPGESAKTEVGKQREGKKENQGAKMKKGAEDIQYLRPLFCRSSLSKVFPKQVRWEWLVQPKQVPTF